MEFRKQLRFMASWTPGSTLLELTLSPGQQIEPCTVWVRHDQLPQDSLLIFRDHEQVPMEFSVRLELFPQLTLLGIVHRDGFAYFVEP
jgi:hypothetical protein